MNENIRLFTGLHIPEPVRAVLLQRLPAWQAAYPFRQWTHSADWHVTLHYLGMTDPASVPALEAALAEAAAAVQPFTLRPDRPGTFGRPERPAVLWLGLAGMLDRLHALHAALGAALHRAAGFAPEARPFTPHLTLARKYAGPEAEAGGPGHAGAARDGGPDLPEWRADSITLFHSRSGRVPMYVPLAAAPLGERSGPA